MNRRDFINLIVAAGSAIAVGDAPLVGILSEQQIARRYETVKYDAYTKILMKRIEADLWGAPA